MKKILSIVLGAFALLLSSCNDDKIIIANDSLYVKLSSETESFFETDTIPFSVSYDAGDKSELLETSVIINVINAKGHILDSNGSRIELSSAFKSAELAENRKADFRFVAEEINNAAQRITVRVTLKRGISEESGGISFWINGYYSDFNIFLSAETQSVIDYSSAKFSLFYEHLDKVTEAPEVRLTLKNDASGKILANGSPVTLGEFFSSSDLREAGFIDFEYKYGSIQSKDEEIMIIAEVRHNSDIMSDTVYFAHIEQKLDLECGVIAKEDGTQYLAGETVKNFFKISSDGYIGTFNVQLSTTTPDATFPVKTFYNVLADVEYNFNFITKNNSQSDVNYTLKVTNSNGKVVTKNVSFNVNRPAMKVTVESVYYNVGDGDCNIQLKIEQENVTDYLLYVSNIGFHGSPGCENFSEPNPAQIQGDPGKYYAFGLFNKVYTYVNSISEEFYFPTQSGDMSDCNKNYTSTIGNYLPLTVLSNRQANIHVQLNSSTGVIHSGYQRANENIVRMDKKGTHEDWLTMNFSVYDGQYDQLSHFTLNIPVVHGYGHETIDHKGAGWKHHTGRITLTFNVGDASNFSVTSAKGE
ncbi:MAG: hypothetical protein PUG15_05000 [Bacteroidales bacterium]|nr:hypothetical protein [Bacteroidales bacterium]